MSNLFVYLWFGTIVCFWIAMFKPSAFSHVTRRTHKRKHLLGFFVAAGAVCLFTVGVTAPPATTTAAHVTKPEKTTKTVNVKAPARPTEVVVRQVHSTIPVPFDSQTVDDSSLPKGQSIIKQTGQAGVETLTYSVTFTNGKETGRQKTSDAITTPAVTQITAIGTYVAPVAPKPLTSTPQPAPTVSTYTPVSSGARTGAICNDGTSSNATGSGACSHHHGVNHWLY